MMWHRRLLTLGCLLTLTACSSREGSSVAPPIDGTFTGNSGSSSMGAARPAGKFVAGHLYVSAASYPFESAPVMRYPLVNGVPASNPDLVYPSSLFASFSVDAKGRLYGIDQLGSPGAPFNIVVFAPNSTKPERTIAPYQPYNTGYVGITGRDGYAYVSFFWSSSSRTQRPVDAGSPSSFCAFAGFVVYGPRARGKAPWKSCTPATYVLSENNWISLDPSGNLYVPAASPRGWGVGVYANAATKPVLVRSMTGKSFRKTSSVADDGSGNIYVPGSVQPAKGPAYSYVATYLDSGDGRVTPVRTVRYATPQLWYGNAVADDRYLYIGGDQQVLVYDKTAQGPRMPLATLAVPDAVGSGPTVAIGP
jgi:hypothetical protein